MRRYEEVDVGGGPGAGLREITLPRVGALQYEDFNGSIGERNQEAVELLAHAGGATPAVVQVRCEHVREGLRGDEAPGFTPPPQQWADSASGGRDAKRPGIYVGRELKRYPPGDVRQHRGGDSRDLRLCSAEGGDGHLRPEVARVLGHGVAGQPRVDDVLWVHVPKASAVPTRLG